MGAAGSAAAAAAEGASTAAYLRGLGIDVDLAPVLDTPASSSRFLGSRVFSGDPGLNARLGTAFLLGLQRAGVAATAKHFPGLGTAPTTTDTSNVVLMTPARDLDTRLLPFERAVGAGVDLVMVSNAGYTAYDATGVPADLSRPIVTGLLRDSLGFRGVVITDAMEAPGPSSRAEAAVDALAAGDDVLLYTNEADSAAAFAQIVAAAESGALPVGGLRASAARIEALKRRLAGHLAPPVAGKTLEPQSRRISAPCRGCGTFSRAMVPWSRPGARTGCVGVALERRSSGRH
jgi:beta-N-acetylhexosaminidase